MAVPTTHHKFDASAEPVWVLAAMASCSASGAGWINIQPSQDASDDPEPFPAPGGWFSSTASGVPMVTWTAPQQGRKPSSAGKLATLGIQHGAGMRVLPWLRERGSERPMSWRVLADSPRRGVVLELPADADPTDVVRWMLAVLTLLSRDAIGHRFQATRFAPA